MRLIIIRHGDPDYSIDSLTPTGEIEAELLAERIAKLDIKAFYQSPLGRAKRTAFHTLKKMGREAETLDWLREFDVYINKPGQDNKSIAWDWYPSEWTKEARFYDNKRWTEPGPMAEANMKEGYERVCEGLDELLSKHGYDREGNIYRVREANKDIIVLFCHFGLECVLLSHLLEISPMALWHGTAAAPSSVTVLYTEEREEGIASFRMTAFGDTSHLYKDGRKPSFSARFCECFADDERHD